MKSLQKFILKNPVFSIVVFAIIVRVIAYLSYPSVTIFNDSEDYLNLAERLKNFNFKGYGGYRTPGYPILLLLALQSTFLVAVFQHALGVMTGVFMYHLIRKGISNKTIALISAALYCSFVHVLFFEKGILTETIAVFLLTWLLFVMQKSVLSRKFKPHQYGLLSFILLMLVMTKPFFIYLLPLLVIFFIFLLGKTSRWRILKPILILCLPTIIAYTGWSMLNKENTGYYTITSYYGINIAQEIVFFVDKAPDEYETIRDIYVKQRDENKKELGYVYYSIWDAHEEMMAETGLNFFQLSARLATMSKETILQNPTDYMKQIGLSWVTFWKSKVYWDHEKFNNATVKFLFKGVWFLQRIVLAIIKWAFVVSFLVSLVFSLRKKSIPMNMLTFIFAIVICGSILQAMVNYSENFRFSFPFLPAIIIALTSYIVKIPVYLARRK